MALTDTVNEGFGNAPCDAARERFGKSLKLQIAKNASESQYAKPCNEARKHLWNSLYPSFPITLYRFDSALVKSKFERRLDDVRRERLYLAPANSFNDVYDAFPYVSPDYLANGIRNGITQENMALYLQFLSVFMSEKDHQKHLSVIEPFLKNMEEWKEEMIVDLTDHLDEYLQEFRSHIRVACLTDDVIHGPMWAYYANNGNGFAVSYEIAGEDSLKVIPGPLLNTQITLCPIQYDSRLDLGALSHAPFHSQPFIPYWTTSTYLALIASASHKGKQWTYEREWRFEALAGDGFPDKAYLGLKASGIYLGYSLSEIDSRQVCDVASDLDIPAFRVMPDYLSQGTSFQIERIG